MTMLLTQQEADALLALEKHYRGNEIFEYPSLGGCLRIPLYSSDHREEFSLDITRGRIELRKNTFQTRARKAVILVRVDLEGPPHRNPDDVVISCPHIHIYKEGYGDKWATSLPSNFTNCQDIGSVLNDFMVFCNVLTKPPISQDMFT